jgi:uncharacterized protein (TIGR02058 family)
MAEKCLILEMGTGNDLYGMGYTKAACRAVQEALHHSSIVLLQSLGDDHQRKRFQVTIGVQERGRQDHGAIAAELPRGRAEVTGVLGGLNVFDSEQGTTPMVATAALEAFLDIDPKDWALSPG